MSWLTLLWSEIELETFSGLFQSYLPCGPQQLTCAWGGGDRPPSLSRHSSSQHCFLSLVLALAFRSVGKRQLSFPCWAGIRMLLGQRKYYCLAPFLSPGLLKGLQIWSRKDPAFPNNRKEEGSCSRLWQWRLSFSDHLLSSVLERMLEVCQFH